MSKKLIHIFNAKLGRRAAALLMVAVMSCGLIFSGCKKSSQTETNADGTPVTTVDSTGEGTSGEGATGEGATGEGATGEGATGEGASGEGTTGGAGSSETAATPQVIETYSAPTYEDGANNERVAMTVNGKDIGFPAAVFFAQAAKNYYAQFYAMYGMQMDSSFWGAVGDAGENLTYADAALEEVRQSLVQTAILNEHYAEYGEDGLDADSITKINEGVDNMFSGVSAEELANAGITEESLGSIKEIYHNALVVRERMLKDFQYEASDDEARTLSIRIFALTTGEEGDTEADSPDYPTLAEASAAVKSALDRIKAGEDADTVVSELGTTITSDSLYASQYDTSSPLLDEIMSMNAGDVKVYEDTDYNSVYGIICDEVNNPDKLAETKEAIRSAKAQENFDSVYASWEEAASDSYDEAIWNEIKNIVFADRAEG